MYCKNSELVFLEPILHKLNVKYFYRTNTQFINEFWKVTLILKQLTVIKYYFDFKFL